MNTTIPPPFSVFSITFASKVIQIGFKVYTANEWENEAWLKTIYLLL